VTRSQFRDLVEGEMQAMGWPEKSYLWAAPSKLVLIVNGQLREVTMHANMGWKKLNRALGRLEGWADALGLRTV
jgi:hypothetical protein